MNYANVFKEEDKKKKENIERLKKYKLDKLTILGVDKICQLDIFKKFGMAASMTDFSCIVGCKSASKKYYTSDRKNSSEWWTNTKVKNREVYSILVNGTLNSSFISNNCGVRPALVYPGDISNYYNIIKDSSGLDAILCGEYPQYLANSRTATVLERKYKENKLKTTGKYYTLPTECGRDTKCLEYEYNGNKYIRIYCDIGLYDGYIFSSGGWIVGGWYWVKVAPIVWFVESNIAVSKYILFSGIPFISGEYSIYREEKFDETDIGYFLINTFKKEIEMDKVQEYSVAEPKIQLKKEKQVEELTLSKAILEAKMEMREILGEEYSYILNETQEESFQKVKKMVL